jgi:hypothetical protein
MSRLGLIGLALLLNAGCWSFPEDRLSSDGGNPDAVPDTWTIQQDAAEPDAPMPDAPMPDAPMPDAPLPDAPLPDVLLPDAPLLDAPLPDTPPPDATMPDAPATVTALFVASSTLLSSSDTALRDRMVARGYTVEVAADDNSQATLQSKASDKDVVVISESVSSSTVGTKLTNVPVGVMIFEYRLYDEMQMAGSSSSVSGQTLDITAPGHALAAGLTGTRTVYSSCSSMHIGSSLGAGATVVAERSGNAAIFGYETGAQMVGMIAPARRVGLFIYNDCGDDLSGDGRVLFDAAVDWAAGSNSGPYDPAQYNFETSTQSWQATYSPALSVAQSSAQAYAGTHSLEVVVDTSVSSIGVAEVESQPLPPDGQTVTFHVYVPTKTGLQALQAFVEHGPPQNDYFGEWVDSVDLVLGWNTITLTVPYNSKPVVSIGVEFFTDGTGSTSSFYIDSVGWGYGTVP